jgi:hypothetical protein
VRTPRSIGVAVGTRLAGSKASHRTVTTATGETAPSWTSRTSPVRNPSRRAVSAVASSGRSPRRAPRRAAREGAGTHRGVGRCRQGDARRVARRREIHHLREVAEPAASSVGCEKHERPAAAVAGHAFEREAGRPNR